MTLDVDRTQPDAQPVHPAVRVGTAFKAAVAALRRMRGQEVRDGERLSDAQYWLLFALCEKQPMSSRELAHAAELTSSSVTEMLEFLEAAGLVERTRSAHDRRVVHTSLTARGSKLVEVRKARVEAELSGALAEFSEDELATAERVLQRLRAMFDAEIAGE